METAETAMETDGDGSGGHFPVSTGCRKREIRPSKFVFDGGGAAELFWEKR
jgi:hypothetical protein